MSSRDDLQKVWEDRVNSRCLLRGMGMKDITDPLDPVVLARMAPPGWRLVQGMSDWVSTSASGHRRALLPIRRSCAVPDASVRSGSSNRLLPIGPFAPFLHNAEAALGQCGLDREVGNVLDLLPEEDAGFDFRVRVAIPLKHIEAIEEDPEPGVA